jgi:hypothetical protein
MFTLYHNTHPLALMYPEQFTTLWQEKTRRDQSFTRVAKIEAPFASVFALSQHLDCDWTANPEVVWHAPGEIRSTSVGDVIVSTRGDAWMILPCGYTLLESRPARWHGWRKRLLIVAALLASAGLLLSGIENGLALRVLLAIGPLLWQVALAALLIGSLVLFWLKLALGPASQPAKGTRPLPEQDAELLD